MDQTAPLTRFFYELRRCISFYLYLYLYLSWKIYHLTRLLWCAIDRQNCTKQSELVTAIREFIAHSLTTLLITRALQWQFILFHVDDCFQFTTLARAVNGTYNC